jgi:hypothetical protein
MVYLQRLYRRPRSQLSPLLRFIFRALRELINHLKATLSTLDACTLSLLTRSQNGRYSGAPAGVMRSSRFHSKARTGPAGHFNRAPRSAQLCTHQFGGIEGARAISGCATAALFGATILVRHLRSAYNGNCTRSHSDTSIKVQKPYIFTHGKSLAEIMGK